MKYLVPATTISPSSLSTFSGSVGYTAIIASQEVAGKSALTAKFIVSFSLFSGITGPSSCQGIYAARGD